MGHSTRTVMVAPAHVMESHSLDRRETPTTAAPGPHHLVRSCAIACLDRNREHALSHSSNHQALGEISCLCFSHPIFKIRKRLYMKVTTDQSFSPELLSLVLAGEAQLSASHAVERLWAH